MSTFLTALKAQICITIDYTKGYETPAVCFVKLDCATIGYLQHQVIKGIAGCLSTTVHSDSAQYCNLSATDIDAMDVIDTTPAVVITVMLAPDISPSASSVTPMSTSGKILIKTKNPHAQPPCVCVGTTNSIMCATFLLLLKPNYNYVHNPMN